MAYLLTNVTVSNPTTVRARAFKNGMIPSAITVGTYGFSASAPVLNKLSGTYFDTFTVTATTSTSNSVIRFTTNGSAPSETSPAYAGPISINQSTVVRARTFRQGWVTSDETSGAYELRVRTPTFTPETGVYDSGQVVTISSATSGSTIRYTVDHTVPNATSPAYLGPILLPEGEFTQVYARAFRAGWTESTAVSRAYRVPSPGEEDPETQNNNQSSCADCVSDQIPLTRRWTHTDGRQLVYVQIHSSWDKPGPAGHTDDKIWNAVTKSLEDFNARQTAYYFVLDQLHPSPQIKIIRSLEEYPCGSLFGCAPASGGDLAIVELADRITDIRHNDNDRQGFVTHDISHHLGLANATWGGCRDTIMAKIDHRDYPAHSNTNWFWHPWQHLLQDGDVELIEQFASPNRVWCGRTESNNSRRILEGDAPAGGAGIEEVYVGAFGCWEVWQVTYYYHPQGPDGSNYVGYSYDFLLSTVCGLL